jgi:hypothetical protein
VSQTQKAEILSHLVRCRLLLLTCTLAIFVLLGSFIAFVMLSPATFIRLVEPALRLGFGTFFLIIVLMLALVIAPIVAVPQIYLFRGLRPLLAAAPRTAERIEVGEQLRKIAESISTKVLIVGMIGGLGMMGGGVLQLHNPFLVGVLLTAGGLLTTCFIYLVRLKATLERDAR